MAITGSSACILVSSIRGAGPSALEPVETFLREAKELGFANLEVMGLNHGVVNRLGDELAARFLLQRRVVLADETPLAGNRLDHPLALELGVGLGHRVPIDPQLLGH